MHRSRLLWATALVASLTTPLLWAQTPDPAAGAASATPPAQKKPAKSGVQAGAASGPGAGSGADVTGGSHGHGAGQQPAEKKRAKPGAEAGAASTAR